MLKDIRAGLIRLAKRIGHWLVKRLAKWVAGKLIGYMESRIEDWRERKVPPKGRIRRWTAAVLWLKAQLRKLEKVAVSEYDALASELERKGVPEAVA